MPNLYAVGRKTIKMRVDTTKSRFTMTVLFASRDTSTSRKGNFQFFPL